jgi:SAM-dependent methyltransferase
MVGANGYVLGADGSQKMLELAEARLVTAGVQPLEDGSSQNGVGLLHARLDSMTSALGEFDVVLADRLIGHLDDPRLGLEQLGGLCRRGGRVVVVNMLNSATVVNLGADEAARRLAHRVLAWRSERGTTSAWAAPVVPSLAVQAGLQPVDVRYWTFPCRSLAATYPHSPLIEYGDHAAHDGAISESDAALWRQLLSATDRDGLFSALFVVRADVLIRP